MKTVKFLIIIVLSSMMFSCVSTKKYNSLNESYQKTLEENRNYAGQVDKLKTENNGLESSNRELASKNKLLDEQIAYLRSSGNQVINTLQDMSVLSAKQAESMKESLKNLSEKEAFINGLQAEMRRKDSLNMNLVMNLKSSLKNINDDDVNIKVEKGVVYIDISDKMLFATGQYNVTERARMVLGKIASVLNAHPELDVMVEGHTDNVPIHTEFMNDNWDLSVMRATSVVRILEQQYKISPVRMSAAGHGKYDPIASNDTSDGRAQNRRTRIIVLPQLDQFFNLLVKK
jgi:chemotaxis protein MotB